MLGRCFVVSLCSALVGLVAPALAAGATDVAPSSFSNDGPRTTADRQASRSPLSPKYAARETSTRLGLRPGTFGGGDVPGGAYDLLLDGGTVFTLRNGTDVYHPADMVYNGPSDTGSGINTATPAPGAALLAALGLGMVGFIRRRVGLAPVKTE